MKRPVLSLLFFVGAGLPALASQALAQNAEQPEQLRAYYTVVPLHGASNEEALSGSAAATTIPISGYTFTSSRDGMSHTGTLVGRSPFFHGARTIDIKAVLIPVVFKLKDQANNSVTDTFDPTAADATCSPQGVPFTLVQNSPIFQATHDFTMPASGGINVGTGQYIDEFHRASFWSNVSVTHDRFHNVLSPITIAPTQIVTPPSTSNGLGYQPNQFLSPPCTALGVIDAAFWDPALENMNSTGEAQTIITNLTTAGTIGPTTLPIFIFYNVVIAVGNSPFSGCCILGYHSSQGNPVQTFSIADYESTGLFAPGEDISALSHEIGEWMDDPLGNNLVASWGHIGQVSGCQNNLEVGDPLSGTQFPSVVLSGMTYHPQEMAFFSWFLGTPSLGVDGDFSNNATFTVDAGAPCT